MRDGEFLKCIGCICNDCVNMRKASQTKTLSVNEVDPEKRCQHECCRKKEHNLRNNQVNLFTIDDFDFRSQTGDSKLFLLTESWYQMTPSLGLILL